MSSACEFDGRQQDPEGVRVSSARHASVMECFHFSKCYSLVRNTVEEMRCDGTWYNDAFRILPHGFYILYIIYLIKEKTVFLNTVTLHNLQKRGLHAKHVVTYQNVVFLDLSGFQHAIV